MHSSRMRTGRSLTICCSLLPGRGGSAWSGGGGVCLVRGGCCLPGPRGGVCLVRGVSAWSWGGCLPGPGGVLPDGGGLPGAPPPVNRITHTCKNITLATTSLRPVIKQVKLNIFNTHYCIVKNINTYHCRDSFQRILSLIMPSFL